MGKIYIKTISGRKYRYERLSSKRVNGKVVTEDRYLGPVQRVQGAFDRMDAKQKGNIKKLWKDGEKTDVIVRSVDMYTNRKYAANTVEKWCREQFGQRGKR